MKVSKSNLRQIDIICTLWQWIGLLNYKSTIKTGMSESGANKSTLDNNFDILYSKMTESRCEPGILCIHSGNKGKYVQTVLQSLYIVTCQRGGVSNKPPGLQAATRHEARDPDPPFAI